MRKKKLKDHNLFLYFKHSCFINFDYFFNNHDQSKWNESKTARLGKFTLATITYRDINH